MGWIPGSGRSPGQGNGNPRQYSCLDNLMRATVRQGCKELDRIGRLRARATASVGWMQLGGHPTTWWGGCFTPAWSTDSPSPSQPWEGLSPSHTWPWGQNVARGWQGHEPGPWTLHPLGLGTRPSARMSRPPTRMINPKHQGKPKAQALGPSLRASIAGGDLCESGQGAWEQQQVAPRHAGRPPGPAVCASGVAGSVSVHLRFLFLAPQVHGAGVGPPLWASLGTGLAQRLQGQRWPLARRWGHLWG